MRVTVWQTGAESPWCFMRWDFAKSHGFDFDEYDPVWEGDIDGSGMMALENLFELLNVNHPADYTARSLSMSDIVETDDGYFYCDTFGWEDITAEIVAGHYSKRGRRTATQNESQMWDMLRAYVEDEVFDGLFYYVPADVMDYYDRNFKALEGVLDFNEVDNAFDVVRSKIDLVIEDAKRHAADEFAYHIENFMSQYPDGFDD